MARRRKNSAFLTEDELRDAYWAGRAAPWHLTTRQYGRWGMRQHPDGDRDAAEGRRLRATAEKAARLFVTAAGIRHRAPGRMRSDLEIAQWGRRRGTKSAVAERIQFQRAADALHAWQTVKRPDYSSHAYWCKHPIPMSVWMAMVRD